MEIHPIDSGVIRCICKFEHDDGFTLQCEQCNAWQHGVCVGISTEDEAPEIFMCNRCGKLELDPAKAREKQMEYLRRRNRRRNTNDAKNKRAKDPEFQDHPGCFYNHIDQCEYSSESPFNRNLPTVRIPEFSLSLKRVSNHFTHSAFGLETNVDLRRGEMAAEVTGEVDWLVNYIKNPLNQYGLLGCPKPAVIFVEGGFVVDSRRRGNWGAFLQKSASPNCRVIPFNDEHGSLRIIVVATTDIPSGTLLTVPWTWDSKHPIKKPASTHTSEETAIVERSLARLREFGLEGSVRDFLPSSEMDDSLIAALKVKTKKEKAPKRPLLEITEPKQEFVWSVPTVTSPPIKEETPKKRLSLADYKKKRPSAA